MADVRTMRDGTSIERRYLHFLVEVGEILGESLDYTSTLQRVCEAAVRTVADAATMYLFEDGKLEVVGAAHFLDERSSDFRDNIVALIRDLTGPRRRIEEVIRGGRGFLVEYVDDDSIDSIASGNDHARFMRDLGVRSFVIVPLVSQTRGVLGALGLVCVEESGWRYDQEAMILAEDLGRRCGTAIAKAKLHATALDVSARFQIAALPRSLPRVDGITLDAIYEPASSDMLVGGDWYDAFTLSDGRLGISIGDVSGHGLQAAAFMGSLRDALRVALYLDADMMRALQVA
ncbi:MAG TPA: GAF domain-containing protein, partial [Candidatus Cybelea sp.]|nr:GAF domain-containing protein [Candidatus Cybelea sp.]